MEVEDEGGGNIAWLVLIVLGEAFLYYQMRDFTMNYTPPTSFFVASAFFLLIIFTAKTSYITFLHYTPKFVAQGFITSTVGEPLSIVGNYELWTKSDIRALTQEHRGSDTFVIPKGTRTRIGEHVVCPIRIFPVTENMIPPELKDESIAKKKNIPKYIGFANEQEYMKFYDIMKEELMEEEKEQLREIKIPKVTSLGFIITELTEKIKLANHYKNDAENFRVLAETITEHASRMKQKSTFDAIKSAFGGGDKENEHK